MADETPCAEAARRRTESESRPARKLWQRLGKPALVLAAVAAMTRLVWTAATSASGSHVGWWEQFLLPGSMLALVCVIAARHELQWKLPLRRLQKLLPSVQGGECPIDELSHIDCPADLQKFVEQIQMVLHDLRRQKLEVAKLDNETRQRIAQRTDALERSIGSLRQQATRDALTGLGNRRMLDISLPQLMAMTRAQKSDLCTLMIDVDNFKKLNDTLGHAAGDQLLRDIAGLIRSTTRETDLSCRSGGDEFVIVMSDCTDIAVDSLIERLSSLMDAHARMLKVDPKPRLSIGAAKLSSINDDASPQDLLDAADKKLYAVKHAHKQDGAAVQSRWPLGVTAPAAGSEAAA